MKQALVSKHVKDVSVDASTDEPEHALLIPHFEVYLALEPPMKKLLFVLIAALIFFLIFVGSFFLGARFDRHQVAGEVDAIQGSLSFNHLLQFREIRSDLSKGCSAEALEVSSIAIDQEMKLLSEFQTKRNAAPWLNTYIADRDPKLLAQLKTFKSKYGNTWIQPQCAK